MVINPTFKSATHQYELGVQVNGAITTITVNANYRSQARAIAERSGYMVRDVNMIG